jgi:hypothetical protein
MSETIEHAREGIHEAHQAHVLHGDSTARGVAVLIAVLAAVLALAEIGEKGAQKPGPQAEIKRARETEARMRDEPQGDGMKQLAERAKVQEAARDEAFHRYHKFELVVGALQIAIVLASVAVVTRITALAFGAGVVGALAAGYGLVVAL